MSRHNPLLIITDALCQYGCCYRAHYRFKSGKVCCSDAIQKCQGHIKQSLATRRQDVDPISGLNAMQRGQAAATKIKKVTGAFIAAGKKISATKNQILEDGTKQCDSANRKMKQTKMTIGEDGLTNAQRSARKSANTRLSDIDENGLNQYQRWTNDRIENGIFDKGFIKGKQVLHDIDTGIRYQGTYELKFIVSLKETNGIAWVKENLQRGPSVQYVDYYRKTRWYLSDYIISNTVYEIKSGWTWNKNGSDSVLEYNNLSKLNAMLAAGHNVKLIRDGEEIEFKKTG